MAASVSPLWTRWDSMYRTVVGCGDYPRQVIWGDKDPALKIATYGEIARQAAGVASIHRLPGKHFLQEDNGPQLADLIADFVASAQG